MQWQLGIQNRILNVNCSALENTSGSAASAWKLFIEKLKEMIIAVTLKKEMSGYNIHEFRWKNGDIS